eukprot:scaffold19127_cov150-Skeletonema_marinoi.AAC.2
MTHWRQGESLRIYFYSKATKWLLETSEVLCLSFLPSKKCKISRCAKIKGLMAPCRKLRNRGLQRVPRPSACVMPGRESYLRAKAKPTTTNQGHILERREPKSLKARRKKIDHVRNSPAPVKRNLFPVPFNFMPEAN